MGMNWWLLPLVPTPVPLACPELVPNLGDSTRACRS
jgi:hypothetical protein